MNNSKCVEERQDDDYVRQRAIYLIGKSQKKPMFPLLHNHGKKILGGMLAIDICIHILRM